MDKIKSIVMGSMGSEGLGNQMGMMAEYALFGTRTDPIKQLTKEIEQLAGKTVSELTALSAVPGVIDRLEKENAKKHVF